MNYQNQQPGSFLKGMIVLASTTQIRPKRPQKKAETNEDRIHSLRKKTLPQLNFEYFTRHIH